MKLTKPWRRERGFSLIELMVGLTLGLFVLAAITAQYIGSKQTYRAGDALSRVQESARVAVENISRDLRMAGAYGCGAANLYSDRAYTCSSTYNRGGLKNLIVNGTTTYAYNFARHVQGFETAVGGSTWSPVLDASISAMSPGPSTGSDVLTVRGPETLGVTVTDQLTPSNYGSANLKARTTTDLAVGDVLVATDCEDAAVFQLTGVTPSPDATNTERTFAHLTTGATPGNQCLELGKEYKNGLLMRVFTRTYYIAPGASGRPSLYRIEGPAATPVELVEGVENLQVQYGLDSDSDGIADSYTKADSIATADWAKVVSVRVDMVVASVDDNVTTKPQTYAFDGASITSADRRLRQVASVTVGLRNRLH